MNESMAIVWLIVGVLAALSVLGIFASMRSSQIDRQEESHADGRGDQS